MKITEIDRIAYELYFKYANLRSFAIMHTDSFFEYKDIYYFKHFYFEANMLLRKQKLEKLNGIN